MITLSHIRQQLDDYRPAELEIGDHKHAAVALILRQGGRREMEALFIERARYQHDPWSGQMAFPGGMVEPFDLGAKQAAERETLEEVGIDLLRGRYLGRLNDQQGRHRGHQHGIVVCGYVYEVDKAVAVKGNHEVEDAVWAPLSRFLDARYYTHITHPISPGENFPGVRISSRDHQVVWGLTRRFMASFFSTINIVFEG